jgi:RNase P/RNase MRP subunit p29
LYKGLIIGGLAEITESRDPSLKGRTGQIVDETKNTIILHENTGRTIRVPKSIIKMKVVSSEERQRPISIIGLELLATPEERIKG